MIVVSACLCGINCRYSGDSSLNKKIFNLLQSGEAIPVCPEQLGGLPTPRIACEIIGGTGKDVLNGKAKVVSKQGNDLTYFFVKGAEESLKVAKACNSKFAILKSRSPSCGFGEIYNGSFNGNKLEGNGITAELFIQNGIKVITEENL